VQKDSAPNDIRSNVRILKEINGILAKIKPTKTAGNQLKCIDCSRPNESFFFDVQTVSSAVRFRELAVFGVWDFMDVSALCLSSCFWADAPVWGRVLFILI